MSASDALSALKALYDVANKVKDNKNELLRVSRRIEHIVVTIEECRNRDVIRPEEYNDALSAIADLITRTQRVAQRLLKRNLGDRTWNASEISSELRRLNDDVQNYLSVHTVRTLDLIHTSNVEQISGLANNVEDIMVKIAELDLYMRTHPGDGWAPSIKLQAETNFARSVDQRPTSLPLSTITQRAVVPYATQSENEQLVDLNFETLKQSGKITVKVTGLRPKDSNSNSLTASYDPRARYREYLTAQNEPLVAHELQLKADASQDEILHAIKDAGFLTPDQLYEEQKLSIFVTEGDSVYDATIPGGLKVNKSEPLLWWWNKYTTYHGLAPATTPGHTIARLVHDDAKKVIGVDAAGVRFSFHRALRVPDTGINNLPASLGTFPLVPVDRFSRGVPPALRDRGGFLMPMFRREAVWLEFGCLGEKYAVKVSVGGVNALSGISTNLTEPPKFGAEQDYIVVGQQPWLDGTVSGPGVIRQFVATGLGSGYTIEEQVTGKAEIGGFQFDIFPRRPKVDGTFFCHAGEELNSIYSPLELDLAEGDQVTLKRPHNSTLISSLQLGWSLADYKRRVSPSATINVVYLCHDALSRSHDCLLIPFGIPTKSEANQGLLGLAAGGQIAQRIYRDKDSPKVYDEERGHRFYVHIVTPELWETITGVLPPITPITRDMYIRNGTNWYKMFDDYVDSITTTSEALSNVLSVTQLDEINLASSAESQWDNLIDPNAPPGCSLHPRSTSICVFRPCNHLACTHCLGFAMVSGRKCPKCQVVVEKFVGMQTPLPDVFQDQGSTYEEGEWSVKETEKLAATAAGSDTVIIIHQPENRPSPLYSSRQPTIGSR